MEEATRAAHAPMMPVSNGWSPQIHIGKSHCPPCTTRLIPQRTSHMLANLYAVNPWVAYGVPTLAILAAAELGRFAGVARRRHRGASMSPEITTLQASMLALLALMIGFTFSMTLLFSRHASRPC
jgi:hypothetical protein